MGKHPRIRNGLTDEAIIRRWWNQWPEANIGVVTGRESGLIVFDIDPSRGEEAIEGYNIPDAAEQLMGRGRQLLFQRPDGDFKLKSATDLRQWQRSAPQRVWFTFLIGGVIHHGFDNLVNTPLDFPVGGHLSKSAWVPTPNAPNDAMEIHRLRVYMVNNFAGTEDSLWGSHAMKDFDEVG